MASDPYVSTLQLVGLELTHRSAHFALPLSHVRHDACNHLANPADLGCHGRAALVSQGRRSKGELLQPRGRAAMRGRSPPDFLNLGGRRLCSQLGRRTQWLDPKAHLNEDAFLLDVDNHEHPPKRRLRHKTSVTEAWFWHNLTQLAS